MKNNTKLALAITAALAATFGASANAVTTTSISFDTSTPVTLTLTDWNSNLLFHKFDTSLGTLVSVTLDFSSSLQTVLTVTNSSSSASSGTAQTELQVTIQDASNGLNAPQMDVLSNAYSYSLDPNENVQSGTLTKTGSSHDVYSSSIILAEFSGTGNISLPVGTFTQTLLANTGGNTAAAQTTSASATGTVTYTYIPVPEPSTALLGLCGLGMVAGFKRRSRSAQA